jgi:hypothetical protein
VNRREIKGFAGKSTWRLQAFGERPHRRRPIFGTDQTLQSAIGISPSYSYS